MSSMSFLRRAALGALILLAWLQAGSAADLVVDGVPLPSDVAVGPAETALQRQWAGAWTGAWGGGLKHVLVVETIARDGAAQVVYAIGGNGSGIRPEWNRHKATVSEQSLAISDGFTATYEARSKDAVEASYARGDARSSAAMARADLAEITAPGASVDWTGGHATFLPTDLAEEGKPVRLEAVIFKPPGVGPFPLAVINHGSTGNGRNSSVFRQTWYNLPLASFLTERGWIVAYPQRRGRGKSDGLYDEGFAENRSAGYTCESEKSLAGADRALSDVAAAVASLRRRPDVAGGRLLIAGQSRGGVLSMAYAGEHPAEIAGVVNFVGGWMGEGCSTASLINQTLFWRAARFERSTLWLYGRNDSFYSIAHSQANFAAFRAAGGKGEFFEFDMPSGNGHYVVGRPGLWSPAVAAYLDSVGSAAK
jgi:dienelactone hydrolase